jgi:hypothetical protein
MYETRGRYYQSFWEFRILIDAGCIHLALGEILCCREIRFLELGSLEVGPLEVGQLEVSSLEVGLPDDGLQQIGRKGLANHLFRGRRLWQYCWRNSCKLSPATIAKPTMYKRRNQCMRKVPC